MPNTSIQIQAIDYGKFQFTEEAEITDAHKNADHTAKTNIWQNYIGHLISGTLTESEAGKNVGEYGDVDPVQIAEFYGFNSISVGR